MKRKYLISTLSLLLCGWLILASCGGSSTGPGDDDDNDPGNEAPSAPANLNGTSGDQKVELDWAENNENDLSGYNLYRSTSSFSDVAGMDPVNGSELITSANFTDSGLENGTTYYYRLTALDDDNNESEISSELEITPFADPPDRP